MHPIRTLTKPQTPPLAPWIGRIQTLLNYVTSVPPTLPWLLIPAEHQAELSDDEAKALFAALRMHLFGDVSSPQIRTIQRKLHYLNHDERLVLLYGLRYIAMRNANYNRYWPLCLDLLFDNRISLDDLRLRLADDITEQWIALFDATKGRLFRPQFGKRNIKWPLAHAGLLGGDKGLLREFKADLLRRYQQADWEILLTPELLDDFMGELEAWLSDQDLESDSFLQILRSEERGWITAELAQYYVGQIDATVPVEELGSERNNHARAELVYNPSRNQIELRVTMQFTEPQGLVFVPWDGAMWSCAPDASDARYTVSLPLRSPLWADGITITAASETLDLRLRKLPREPVLFNASTGRRVRTWDLGHSYYLLLPNRYKTDYKDDFQRLFPQARTYGQPEGAWQGYTLYWVQVTSLAPDTTSDEGRTTTQINRATDHLDLPPLDSAWQPQVSFVGGGLLQAGYTPHYDVTRPPLLRLTGVWQTPLRIEYQRWNADTHRFETRATLNLPADEHLQEHWLRYSEGDEAVVARHRVLVDGQATEWQTRYNTQRFQQQRLAAHLTILDGNDVVQRPNRATLSEYTLEIQAWPYAQVVLRGKGATAVIEERLRLDATGTARIPVKETVLLRLPHETLELFILWNGLPLGTPVICHAVPAMTSANLLVSFRDDQPDMLEVVGQLRDVEPGTSVLIVVLGAMPWRDQLWQTRKRVGSDGLVELSLLVKRRYACWVLVCTQRGTAQPEGLLLHTLPGQQNDVHLPTLIREGKTFPQWKRCIPFLDTVHMPHDLRQLVRLTHMDTFRQNVSTVHRRKAAWIELSTIDSCKRVDDQRALGIDIPVVLCTWTPSTPSFNRTALYLTPAREHEPFWGELFRRPGVPFAIAIQHPNGVRSIWQDGTLVLQDDDSDVVIRLQPREMVYGCTQCRIVVPLHLADRHAHLEEHGCTCRRDRLFRLQRVRLVAFLDPLDLLRRFQQSLQQIIVGQDIVWPDIFDSWLHTLYDYFKTSGFSQEERWLEGLVEAIGALLRLLDNDFNTELVAHEQLLILKYESALIKLIESIEEL